MKAPWSMKDYNFEASKDYVTKFRPVDIFDVNGKLLFRIVMEKLGLK